MSHKNLNPANLAKPKRVAIVISNPGISTTTGWPVGFWGGELSHPGKTVTGFANVEEDFSDQAVWDSGAPSRDKHVMPWRIEDELGRLGGNYLQAGLWKGFAVRDGNLITGQQNFSGGETAQLLMEMLGR
jgi:hypothetical protein